MKINEKAKLETQKLVQQDLLEQRKEFNKNMAVLAEKIKT